jgi:hypothetical protein
MASHPRESYSVQQRDGNVSYDCVLQTSISNCQVITTTTQTKYEEDVEYSCGPGPIDNSELIAVFNYSFV